MDTSQAIGKPPKAEAKAEPANLDDDTAVLTEMQRLAVVAMLLEVIQNSTIVGQEKGGDTVYLIHLSPTSAGTLAALLKDLKEVAAAHAAEVAKEAKEAKEATS